MPLATDTPTGTATETPLATDTPTDTPTPTPTGGSENTSTFIALADARVAQAVPEENFGTQTTLQSEASPGFVQTSYLRFTVSGISGPIQSVKLLVFCPTNGTNNGPAVYLADNAWIESGAGGITWDTQPPLLSSAFDNQGVLGSNSWVEYDVTALVTGNGTYTFALVADASDGITFSSRETLTPPQLVITLGSGTPAPTVTPTPSATGTAAP